MSGTHEEKFERVEERKMDKESGLTEVHVGIDTGEGDPALNFQPTDAALVQATVLGADGKVTGSQIVSGTTSFQGVTVRDSDSIVRDETGSTSFTHTEVRIPLVTSAPPIISVGSTGLAQELVGEGFAASAERISGQEAQAMIVSPNLQEKAVRDHDEYTRAKESLQKQYDKDLEKKTSAYRKVAEAEAEKIRKELEKQHLRDVEFRKELVQMEVEKQRKEVDLEAKFAKKELEYERKVALDSLDHSKLKTDIEVSMDTAAGKTVSGVTTLSQSMEAQRDVHEVNLSPTPRI